MSSDERHLFGDEQAYITWKRQLEVEARQLSRLRRHGKSGRRKPGRRKLYTSSGLALMRRFWQKCYLRRVMADPESHAKLKEQNRNRTAKYRAAHPGRANELSRASYQRNRDAIRMAQAVYYRENREAILERTRARRAAKKAAQRQQDHVAQMSDMVE